MLSLALSAATSAERLPELLAVARAVPPPRRGVPVPMEFVGMAHELCRRLAAEATTVEREQARLIRLLGEIGSCCAKSVPTGVLSACCARPYNG